MAVGSLARPMRRSCAPAAPAKAARKARMQRIIAFLLPKSPGHYAIGGDPVVLVFGVTEVGAEALEALLELLPGREVLQHLVARTVGEAAALIGVPLGITPGHRGAGTLGVSVIHEGDGRARLQRVR